MALLPDPTPTVIKEVAERVGSKLVPMRGSSCFFPTLGQDRSTSVRLACENLDEHLPGNRPRCEGSGTPKGRDGSSPKLYP